MVPVGSIPSRTIATSISERRISLVRSFPLHRISRSEVISLSRSTSTARRNPASPARCERTTASTSAADLNSRCGKNTPDSTRISSPRPRSLSAHSTGKSEGTRYPATPRDAARRVSISSRSGPPNSASAWTVTPSRVCATARLNSSGEQMTPRSRSVLK
ncbi:MAG: hypothetical protein L6W00_24090 [Lentisphaeria bacterium]|nr:MAG: hypothetical protein L6W00_24090 [Lentisphaeria bacterium]